jgi:hypothetical protein
MVGRESVIGFPGIVRKNETAYCSQVSCAFRDMERMSTEINWEELATTLGLLINNGERGSSEAARRALELLIGEDALRASVDYYIAGRRGAELARCVLWQLHPWSAMRYCYDIFKGRSTPKSFDRRPPASKALVQC